MSVTGGERRVTSALALGPALPSALSTLPTSALVGVLCAAVIVEILVVPTVLPGGTITLLAGTLIGAGRPLLVVAIPVVLAVIAGDQLAYFGGTAITTWWRLRRASRSHHPGQQGHPGQAGRPSQDREAADERRRARSGPMRAWFAATMPSLAGAAGLRYRQFAPRVLVMRVPWLAVALTAGAFAAQSVARLGHVIGLVGVLVTIAVMAGLLVARHRART
jgi:membrane protein DedA with SNARE-associated domain